VARPLNDLTPGFRASVIWVCRAPEREEVVSHYRGYFMKGDRIVAPEIVEAADDAQAMLKAGELLSTSQFVRIEVWQGSRLVGSLSAPAPSHDAMKPAPLTIHAK
jgi:hypothetical protein